MDLKKNIYMKKGIKDRKLLTKRVRVKRNNRFGECWLSIDLES